MAERFAALSRGRDPGGPTDWLTGAEGSSVPALRSFARRLPRTRRRCAPG
jgi:hypothetical protein